MSKQAITYRFRHEPLWLPARRAFQLQVPAAVASWLFDSGSLTRRVIGACSGSFRVRVVDEGMAMPMTNEAQRLMIPGRRQAFVRQVQLRCDKQAWVFARTVIPRRTLTGRQRILTSLGNRPLGAFLFADPHMRRDPVEIAQITPRHRLYAMAVQGLGHQPACIWGRRTVFYLDNKPLLVNEIFLPGAVRCNNA